MALSDACFEFLQSVAEAAERLGRDAHYYSAPDNPLDYGTEIDALRRACVAAAGAPYDPEAGARVLRLATAVMRYHDAVPDTDQSEHLRIEMNRLVHALQSELDPEEASTVPAVVEQVSSETPFTIQAAERLRAMLSKLSKPTYELAIKIISEIGSATVKRMLGL
jgi:hypothetical protein